MCVVHRLLGWVKEGFNGGRGRGGGRLNLCSKNIILEL